MRILNDKPLKNYEAEQFLQISNNTLSTYLNRIKKNVAGTNKRKVVLYRLLANLNGEIISFFNDDSNFKGIKLTKVGRDKFKELEKNINNF